VVAAYFVDSSALVKRYVQEDGTGWVRRLTRRSPSTVNHLTEADRAKLRVAGRGDIKRFFDQVEDRRRDFEVDRRPFKTGLVALRRLEPLSRLYQDGPFGDSSLFAKTLRKINDDRKAGHWGRPDRCTGGRPPGAAGAGGAVPRCSVVLAGIVALWLDVAEVAGLAGSDP
jgi:hypothetical protein